MIKKLTTKGKEIRNLNYNEAFSVQKKILNRSIPDIQLGYFLSVIKLKKATEEEMKGFLDALREETNFIETEISPLDLAVNYDGKNKTPHILPSAIFIVTGAGAKLVGHGAENVPSRFGTTYQEVLKEMGCAVINDKERILKALELSGFSFYHQKLLNPKLHSLLQKRKELGLKSYINIVEKLINPFKTKKMIVGITHKNFIPKCLEIAHHVGFKSIYAVQGLEGGIEPFIDKKTKVFSNKTFGINIIPKNKIPKTVLKNLKSPKENAKLCISILKNEDNPLTHWALLTSSLLLVAYGITDDLKKAYDLSEESLKMNIAYEKFIIYRNISNSRKIFIS